ncbi:MAG TPA: zinc ribbon domain-containing protein [Spirochaetota bacterium]|nr:zinc ribbon domain-containing protein [Spirochaetota bacterium]HOD14650.1 zinc ribbon domain-containing protein [Spirochaetota bacterium]HPG52497.1 zinc ribbon domain-containing protein [Spirochaetota bacterium]HPN12578.1 zinc ribbon domain-containing protein [Spirochaetota bacterium]
MPIYEFTCEACGECFSEIRRIGDDKEVPCQKCGSTNTRKLISSFSAVTSGSSPDCPSASSCSHAGGGG